MKAVVETNWADHLALVFYLIGLVLALHFSIIEKERGNNKRSEVFLTTYCLAALLLAYFSEYELIPVVALMTIPVLLVYNLASSFKRWTVNVAYVLSQLIVFSFLFLFQIFRLELTIGIFALSVIVLILYNRAVS